MEYLTDKTFDISKIENDKFTLIDFYADWCSPCKSMEPSLTEISNTINDLRIIKVDIEKSKNTAYKYGIQSIPTFVLIKKGNEPKKLIGYQSLEQLQNFINE